jgi:hypothetical protein
MAAIGHPIVGDGKYGGREAFLTGTISRKMHLHARRLRVDSPEGGQVDVFADLPQHFIDTIANLGFTQEDGDALTLDEAKFGETPEGKKRAVAQKAKAARKERKGERRGRAVANSERPASKGASKGPSKGRGESRSEGRGEGKPARPAGKGHSDTRSPGKPTRARAPARGKPSGPARPKKP